MKQRMVIFFFAIVGMALQSVAQKVLVPKFDKIVKIDEGVNIRQRPTTASPRLVEFYVEEEDCGDGDGMTIKWEESKDRKYHPKPVPVDVAGVIGETGDWYKVVFDGYYEEAYIAKRFCHEVKIRPLKFTPSSRTRQYKNYNTEKIEGMGDIMINLQCYVGGMIVTLEKTNASGAEIEAELKAERELWYNDVEPTDAHIKALLPMYSNKASSIRFAIEGYDGMYILPASSPHSIWVEGN